MFARFASRMPMATRSISSVATSKNLNRLFSTTPIPSPHSREYLQLQQKLFKLHNIPTNITTLPEGTKLVGLNVTLAEPHFLSTGPVYNPEILKALSHNEKQEWFDMAKTYYAQLGKYELLCDLNCVTAKSENGIPIHYIDHSLLEATSYTPLEKIFDLDLPGLTLK